VEVRTLTSTTFGLDTCDWPGVKQFLRLERRITREGVTRTTTSYAVTSLPRHRADARRLLQLWRGRWDIENKAFWVRDMVFREDACRIRTGPAPHLMSVVRNAATTLLRALKIDNLSAALREHALKLHLLLHRLRII
jgi:hypothetical protein